MKCQIEKTILFSLKKVTNTNKLKQINTIL